MRRNSRVPSRSEGRFSTGSPLIMWVMAWIGEFSLLATERQITLPIRKTPSIMPAPAREEVRISLKMTPAGIRLIRYHWYLFPMVADWKYRVSPMVKKLPFIPELRE